MPYVEDRGGQDFDGLDPWKGYPVAIVERVLPLCEAYGPWRPTLAIGPETRFFPVAMDRRIDHPFLPSLDLISMDDVELVIEVEKAFSISISDEDAQSIETVGQLIPFVKDRT